MWLSFEDHGDHDLKKAFKLNGLVWLLGGFLLLFLLLVVAGAPLWSLEEWAWQDLGMLLVGFIWVLGVLVFAVGIGGIPCWTRKYAVQELVLVALTFGLALVLLGLLSPVMGALPVLVLGPFAFLLHDIWFKQAFFLLVGVLVGLVPRVGTYFLFHLLWVCSQGLLHGYVSPGLLLFGGVSVACMEGALFLSGVTRLGTHTRLSETKHWDNQGMSNFEILKGTLAGAMAMGLVVWLGLQLWQWLYRLEWSWWYAVLQMVSGGIHGGMGLGWGFLLSRRLIGLRRGWHSVGMDDFRETEEQGEKATLKSSKVAGRMRARAKKGLVLLEGDNLSFQVSSQEDKIFKDVSLRVSGGELVGLCGRSGSGKSSLLWQLQGLLASGGGLLWGKKRGMMPKLWKQWGIKQWARHCGLLFQEVRPQLLRTRVADEVGLAAYLGGLKGQRWEWAVQGGLARFGLEEMKERAVGTLSGGEMQRLALAVLWVGRHQVLLLDEPFSHQDGYWRRRLMIEIKRQVQRGLGVLVAEHRHRVLGGGVRWVCLQQGTLVDGWSPKYKLGSNQSKNKLARGEVYQKHCHVQGKGLEILNLCFERAGGKRWGPLRATLNLGNMVGLVGANGSGKSSLLEVCMGLHHRLRGQIHWNGEDIAGMSVSHRARIIGWLPQESNLALGELTGRLELQRVLQLGGWKKKLGSKGIQERINKCLARLNLENVSDKPLLLLSAGERRRMALATAIVHSPRVLLLDEPLAGAGIAEAKQLLGYLRQLVQEGWVGLVLLATHDIDIVQSQVDRWWVLWNGAGRIRCQIAGKKTVAKDENYHGICGKLRVVTSSLNREIA